VRFHGKRKGCLRTLVCAWTGAVLAILGGLLALVLVRGLARWFIGATVLLIVVRGAVT
jgi:hypothetical protein